MQNADGSTYKKRRKKGPDVTEERREKVQITVASAKCTDRSAEKFGSHFAAWRSNMMPPITSKAIPL